MHRKRLIPPILLLVFLYSCAQSADVIRVTLLGTGTPRPDVYRAGAAVLVEAGSYKLLFDAGRGVVTRLHQLHVPLAEINAVFLTHLHFDHVVGLSDLLLSGWIYQRTEPLQLWGPHGTRHLADNLVQAFAFDIDMRSNVVDKLPKSGVEFDVRELKQGIVFEHAGMTVTAFNVDHGPVAPAFGYRIQYGERVIVISGDTKYSENLIRHAKGADLLIHEVAVAPQKLIAANPRLQRIMDYHTTPEYAARVFNKTKPRMAVYTHLLLLGGISEQQLVEMTRNSYAGPLTIGEDLMVFDVGEKIVVTRVRAH